MAEPREAVMHRSHTRRSSAPPTVFAVALLVAVAALFSPGVSQAGPLFGLQGGLSFSPDQVVIGLHLKLPNIAEKLEFMPSADVGFGDDLTSFALNGDLKYHLAPENKLDPYLGAGLTANWFDGEGDMGGNVIGGLHVANRVFIEAKLGLGDVPDAKLMAGLTF
jgi:hypothetical protein